MAWKTEFLRAGPLLLEYKIHTVPGKQWLVLIHGFGQDYRCFNQVLEKIGNQVSLLAIHLPFHGESRMEDAVLSPEVWRDGFLDILKKHETGAVHGLAFSMGARFLLDVAAENSEVFRSLTLLAPDGLVRNPWYRFATSSAFGRVCLRIFLLCFPIIRNLLLWISSTGIVRKGMVRFAASELNSQKGRRRLEAVWLGFRLIWPDLSKLKQAGNENLSMKLVLGKYDSILPLNRYRKFLRNDHFFTVEVLDCGHASLIDAWINQASENQLFSDAN
jgi:pimeloyl-ACP methyl ester carboxylesterase